MFEPEVADENKKEPEGTNDPKVSQVNEDVTKMEPEAAEGKAMKPEPVVPNGKMKEHEVINGKMKEPEVLINEEAMDPEVADEECIALDVAMVGQRYPRGSRGCSRRMFEPEVDNENKREPEGTNGLGVTEDVTKMEPEAAEGKAMKPEPVVPNGKMKEPEVLINKEAMDPEVADEEYIETDVADEEEPVPDVTDGYIYGPEVQEVETKFNIMEYVSVTLNDDCNAPKKTALRRGIFQFDDGPEKGDFTFVPEHYNFHSNDGFLNILKAIQLPIPQFVVQ
jgi:hypothetical protein